MYSVKTGSGWRGARCREQSLAWVREYGQSGMEHRRVDNELAKEAHEEEGSSEEEFDDQHDMRDSESEDGKEWEREEQWA
mmetsp:Transcript_47842/g.85411  ORF Transcript_47842/g.85411 Transcript_47842/m.85411 type:complete len:80 (+) Transcript_47842:462-701(+)